MCNKNFIHTCCTIKTICQINNEQALIVFLSKSSNSSQMMLLICKLALPLLFLGGGSPRRVFSYESITLGFFLAKERLGEKMVIFPHYYCIFIAYIHLYDFFQSYACTSVFGGLREGVHSHNSGSFYIRMVEKVKCFLFLISNAFSLHIFICVNFLHFPRVLCMHFCFWGVSAKGILLQSHNSGSFTKERLRNERAFLSLH